MILMILYIIGRMPIPLLVIPLVGCSIIYISNEIKEIRDEKKNKKRDKEITKTSDDNS
jgi:hypothetical protein